MYQDWPNLGYDALDPIGWKNPQFAQHAHEKFLENPYDLGRYDFRRWFMREGCRWSINTICWFGPDLSGCVGDEEPWITMIMPRKTHRPIGVCGDSVVVHFAFFTQRDHLDQTGLLQAYTAIAPRIGTEPGR
jgi:hypothetical protein